MMSKYVQKSYCNFASVIYKFFMMIHIGIGCLRETYLFMFCMLLVLALTIIKVTTSFDEYLSTVLLYAYSTLLALYGLLPIYIALYYIKSCEGTLNVKDWKSKFQTQIYNQRSSMISIGSNSMTTTTKRKSTIPSSPGLPSTPITPLAMPISSSPMTTPMTTPLPHLALSNTVSDLKIVVEPSVTRSTGKLTNFTVTKNNENIELKQGQQQQTEEKQDNKKNSVVGSLHLDCLTFLKTEDNYRALATYLGHCFALENLLFLEKVSILYQIIKKYKTTNDLQRGSMNRPSKNLETVYNHYLTNKKMKRCKFEYLNAIYFSFQDKINRLSMKYNKGSNISDIGTFYYYKKALFRVYKVIYDEYIENGSRSQINVSAETREELAAIFLDENAMNRFNTFEDFMYVFDPALIEIYTLVFGIFSYRFKKWAKINCNNN